MRLGQDMQNSDVEVVHGATKIARFLGFDPKSASAAAATIASLRRQGCPISVLGGKGARLVATRRALLAWIEARAAEGTA